MEGLAYLTLDADVKDDFVQDIPALQAMFELAKVSVALTLASGKIYWIQSHRATTKPGILVPCIFTLAIPSSPCVNPDWSVPFSPSFFLTTKWAHNSSCLPGSGKMNKRIVFFPRDLQEVRS